MEHVVLHVDRSPAYARWPRGYGYWRLILELAMVMRLLMQMKPV